MLLVFTLDLWLSTLLTVVIFVILIVLFLLQRTMIESKKTEIKSQYVVLSYVMMFIVLGASIIGMLWLWGYDASDYLDALWKRVAEGFEDSVSRLIGTLVIVFVSLTVLKLIKISLFRVGRKPSANQRRKKTIAKIILSISKYVIAIIAVLSTLAVWGINVGPALAGLGILGLVIGLGAQKLINDLISGFFIVFEQHFDVGDMVDINGFLGEVIDIGLKTTKLRNFKGEVRIFNNGSISPISNFSRADSAAIVDFGIAYGENIAKATEVLNRELPKIKDELPNLLTEPAVLGVTDLADSSVNLRVMAKTVPMTHWGVERALRQRIKEILDANGIEIPFPQVVVHNPKK